MDFKELIERFLNTKGVKEFRNLAEMTESEIESLGKKILAAGKSAGDKTINFMDNEGADMLKKATDKLKKMQEKGSDSVKEYIKKYRDSDTDVDIDDFFESTEPSSSSDKGSPTSDEEKSKDKKGDFIDRILKKAEEHLDSAEELISDKTNLEALKDLDIIPDSFIEKARNYADTTISRIKKKKDVPSSDGGDIHGFKDHDGDGDSLIDDAIIEEE